MKITVAICTWNRADLLDQTLEVMTSLVIPAGHTWEVVVVDNNSTDSTPRVLEKFQDRLPLRGFFEPVAGHSHARNRAVAEATGDLIIWTDDDVRADVNWLEGYARAVELNPDASFFAGPVVPWFEVAPPAWFQRHIKELTGVIVCVDHGRTRKALLAGDTIFGANMAVLRDVARQFPFNPRLGRVKDLLTGGDDTDFIARLIEAGHRGAWVPDARVDHFVPKSRVTKDYVRRWFLDAGRTFVRRSPPLTGPFIAGVPRWVLREYIQQVARAAFWTPAANEKWFAAYRRSLMLRGTITEVRASRAS